MTTSLQIFYNRLRYGKHTFNDHAHVFAAPHTNPDGTKGGWVAETALVESECWINEEAEVYEFAQVRDNAKVLGRATVNGFANVAEDAILDDWAYVTDNSVIQGDTYIGGNTIVSGDSYVDYGKLDIDKICQNLKKMKA